MVFWFRRDLRLNDNHGLFRALASGYNVLPLFIFDKNILNDLSDKNDARISFIYNELWEINQVLQEHNSCLLIRYGYPDQVWRELLSSYNIKAVYCNEDFEPYGILRDNVIKEITSEKDVGFYTFVDHLVFSPDEIMKDDGTPYTVFTPYSRKWKDRLHNEGASRDIGPLQVYPSNSTGTYFSFHSEFPLLAVLGFEKADIFPPVRSVSKKVIAKYHETRNFPALSSGTSRLSVHFRFGTISIREKVYSALKLNDMYVNELIWREFYAQILFHFPRVVNESFKRDYDKIQWRNAPDDFQRWCEGKTGYPLVDAGMRELNMTGLMHNRVRMVAASFLTKHLLIDWRWGEAYFAQKLLDFELASNNGGWQWAAGCGTDAAPYFRIFNPELQMDKFDRGREYVKKYVEEFGTEKYPAPMIDHKTARERCLVVYQAALKGG